MNLGILTVLLAIPLIGAVLLAAVPQKFSQAIKGFAIAFTGVAFAASLSLLWMFDSRTFHMQLVEFVPWIPQVGVSYKLGIDGISFWLVLLTTLLTFLSTIFSVYIEKRVKAYFIMILLLETAMIGVFTALDLVLFYTFFEASLIPMALMIFIWGGENRTAAALKFFLYTFLASIFLLVGIIVMAGLNQHASGGPFTFDLTAIQSSVASGKLWFGDAIKLQPLLFWSFALAFMVKCPMWPFHTWLPDAHTEAPTAGSILLAGVLLKMGTYGFLRFCLPLFPEVSSGSYAALGGWLSAPTVLYVLAIIGITYGAIVAVMQTDLKRLVAYSSVAHMGFVVLGIFSLTHSGLVGGTLQQLNHGISTGALFLLIGFLYERIHTRQFKDMGGLKAQMPIYAWLFLIIMLSSVGLPGTNGFIGEFLAMVGAFEASISGAYGLSWWMPVAAGIGVILASVYLLTMFMRVFYGPITNPVLRRLKDLKPWEAAVTLVFVVFVFWGGLYPNTFMGPMERPLSAVRQMALNPAGFRPSWADPASDINSEGELVSLPARTVAAGFEDYQAQGVKYNDHIHLQAYAPEEGHVKKLSELQASSSEEHGHAESRPEGGTGG